MIRTEDRIWLRSLGENMHRQIVIIALTSGLIAAASLSVRGAGTNADEEAAIRKIIAAHDQKGGGGLKGIPQLADRAIWTGSAKRPMVGRKRATAKHQQRSQPCPGAYND